LKIDDKFVIGYIGTHGMAHKLDIFVDLAVKKDFDPKYHFLFIGTGAEKTKLIEIAESNKAKNVTFLDPVDKHEIPNYLSAIDAALVPLKKSDLFKTVIPSKIFETSSMRVPILLGVEGESKDILEKYNAGLAFEPENLEDFMSKIESLSSNEDIYRSCQEGGTKLAKDFDRVKLANKMITHVETLL
jgi:glycosyltransferase involved in cell wall biosynthesis